MELLQLQFIFLHFYSWTEYIHTIKYHNQYRKHSNKNTKPKPYSTPLNSDFNVTQGSYRVWSAKVHTFTKRFPNHYLLLPDSR